MRLMIVGQLEGYMSEAGKIALQRGAKVAHCEDREQALGALRNGRGADLVMCDVKQKVGELIKTLNNERIHVPVVACGIGSDSRAAVQAIQDGAREFVPLPPDAEMIAAVLEAVAEENNTMIADDPAMKEVVKMADKVAPSEATILITGESGTGKEVMARYIHNKSKRSEGPFIAVNCAAIPENLLESELFGHEKGAFTGATARRIGKFEEATSGTLLLDEVTEMDSGLQAKFLRVLQEREITRIGSNNSVKVDTRIVATTNKDLQRAVQNGEFREDLYYRLNVVNLRLPPLRERPGDIPKLAQFFADKFAEDNGMPKKSIAEEAGRKLQSASWPGNVRELENAMHRAVLISGEEEIEADAVHTEDSPAPAQPKPAAATPDKSDSEANEAAEQAVAAAGGNSMQNPGGAEALIGRTIAEVEREMILNTLDHCLGNRTHAANILGISIRTLRNKLNQYREEGVEIPEATTNG